MNVNAPLSREFVEALARESPAAVANLVMVMQEHLVELRAEIGRLQARVAELEAQNRPPSAPFRRREDERTKSPKKPGRPPGHEGSCRKVPVVIDEVIEVPLPHCPECAGALEMVTPIEQFIEELPVVRPHVTRLTTYEGRCPCCDKLVRSTHPRQTSTAGGCAGVQLGARAVAVAAELKHGLGLTLRKTCRALDLLGGLKVTHSGLLNAFDRAAQKLATEEQNLHAELLKSPVIHTDETSWWKTGPCSLWVFTTPGENGLTLYRVVDHRDRVTFHSVVPPDWPGMLISDCLSVYDTATEKQSKCYSHHLKALRVAMRDQRPEIAAVDDWCGQAKAFLIEAMEHKKTHPFLPIAEQITERVRLENRANELFAPPRPDAAQERFRNRIGKQRDHLLTFLDVPEADATNNLAERQLRGAVIARKLSCGNKTAKGAATWQTLASFAATCIQRGTSLVAFIAHRLPLSSAG